MSAKETLTHEPTGPRWVRWLLVCLIAGTGMAIRLATADSDTPAERPAAVVAPSPTPTPARNLSEIVPPTRTTAPVRCFPTAALAEHMMMDWREQAACVRAYLHALHRREARQATGDTAVPPAGTGGQVDSSP
jgi:hypothetical protein